MNQENQTRSNWDDGYYKLLQLVSNHTGQDIKKKKFREAFYSSPSEGIFQRLSFAFLEFGCRTKKLNIRFSNLKSLQQGVLAFSKNGELGAISKDKSDNPIIYWAHTKKFEILDRAAFKSLNIDWFLSVDRIYEDRSATKERLKNLSVLRSLGALNFIWIAVASAFSNILGLATSLFVMVVYDRVLPNQALDSLYALALGVGVAVVFDIILKSSRSAILEHATKSNDSNTTEEIFEQYVESALDNRTKSIGALSTVVRDYESYKDFTNSATILALIDLPFIFIFIWVISIIGGSLYIIPLITVPIVILLSLIVQPFLVKLTENLSKATQSRQSNLIEVLNGLDVIRANGAYSVMKRRFLSQAITFNTFSARSKRLSGLTSGILTVAQQLSQVAIIVMGYHLFVKQEITMGAIIAAVILLGRTLAPLSKISQTLTRTTSAFSAYKNLKEFFSEARVSRGHSISSLLEADQAAVSISNVTVRLTENSKPLFENLNLKINKGSKVAIIGKTGAGKSTLVRLIAGLVQPESGTVSITGNDVRGFDRAEINDVLGVVFQDSWLFSGSLRENISVGREELDDVDIIKALKLSGINLSDEINETFLDTPIMDRGSNLSGGQRQAVSIARAVVNRPKIFIFDEPTSSLDTQSERNFITNFLDEFKNTTSIFISHKSEIVQMCDFIAIIDNGKIVWEGTKQQYLDMIKPQKKTANADG
jgi:ATP-binding cassette subfamily C protein LapB